MKVRDFLKRYREDSIIQTIAEAIKSNLQGEVRLQGLSGSLDAIVIASIYQINHHSHLVVLHDKEEAAYFQNDLQNLLDGKEILFFPTSYKKPYQYDETENANILMRAEILNRINHKSVGGEIIVTYPEALTEKVINKRSLTNNTFSAKVGDKLDISFLNQLLTGYDFEKTDFVYEAGHFAIRGGIIDFYSYAHELPIRLELFGNEIDNIRTFDPTTQLSLEPVKEIHIIPNVQTKLLHEERQSFLSYLPKNTKIWFKDLQYTRDTIEVSFNKCTEQFQALLSSSGDTKVVMEPWQLFENGNSFIDSIEGFKKIEFGNRHSLEDPQIFTLESEPQPSFNKNFEILTEDLSNKQLQGFENFIAAESEGQIERLMTIFEELGSGLEFKPLFIGLHKGFTDKNLKIVCYTDHEIFERFHRYKIREKHTRSKALTLKELKSLQPGDYVTHIDYGIGKFAGMHKVTVGTKMQEAIRLVYKDDDLLYVSIHSLHKIAKYSGREGVPPTISKLGSPEWENKKKKVKNKVTDIAKDLINLYAKRKKAPGYAFDPDNFLQAELESSFIYEDTPDQAKAIRQVKDDMEVPHPMDRLVCGDVGFGKTEVAIRAAFKAVADSKQVAVLVPTTILAMQHYRTFTTRLADFPVRVEYINRFKSTKVVRNILKDLEQGKVEILIGTHRIVNKDVHFKSLGLLIIDEEQKFGVKVKEKLKGFKLNVDVLTLTATPIPRTLHFSLMGARDLSIISTAPPNRQPITTELHVFNHNLLRDAIRFELKRGGQVFFVHNRISDIEEVANIILRLVPDARIGIAHGQMEGNRLEKAMIRFIEGDYDILVSTNIIESGLDIPNANTIIINQAHMFGLSDLHQMRGRVGRSNRKAFCYLLSPPTIGLTSDARKRLVILEEFSELGDGFKIAMRDLDIRGAGNLLGSEQSGFINDLGFDTYQKILDEAIMELKENEFKGLFEKELDETIKVLVQDCVIETDLELLIPEEYVSNISERLSLYSKLDNLKKKEDLETFRNSIIDRFGPIPDPVKELVQSVRLRWIAESLGFEKVILKNQALKAYFISSKNEEYYKSDTLGYIFSYIQKHPNQYRLKEIKGKLMLTASNIHSIKEAIEILRSLKLN